MVVRGSVNLDHELGGGAAKNGDEPADRMQFEETQLTPGDAQH
jgi:hypothetical protein